MSDETSIELFDYYLPEELIAQSPIVPRDASRLLVLNRATGAIEHRNFFDFPDFLVSGDVLVLNDTRVFKARIFGQIDGRDIPVEVVLLRSRDGVWEALVRKMRRLKVGSVVLFHNGLEGRVIDIDSEGGIATFSFNLNDSALFDFLDSHGEVPLPPYIKNSTSHVSDYQTVFAKLNGSVAAPTAGLHFTEEIFRRLRNKGVHIEFITLHVGVGTFQPIWVDDLRDHKMHVEFVEVKKEVCLRINDAKTQGRRVISIGTTTTRALEGAATGVGQLPVEGFSGDVDIFISPGYRFRVIDGLLTNFHLPRTTLLALVSAFGGREHVLNAYRSAVDVGYRFYSFGDAMFIV